MSFLNAVRNIPAIIPCVKVGLQAMGTNSRHVHPSDSRKCEGSVDIDTCLENSDPNACRWDYVLGYNGQAYFVEVHPASGHITEIIAKCEWLRSWLKTEGAPLAAIHGDSVFHWLSTGGVKGINQRKLALSKVVVNKLKLP